VQCSAARFYSVCSIALPWQTDVPVDLGATRRAVLLLPGLVQLLSVMGASGSVARRPSSGGGRGGLAGGEFARTQVHRTGPARPGGAGAGDGAGGGAGRGGRDTAGTVNVVCPRCRCVVVPPAPVFQCPCGQLMTYSVDGRAPGDGTAAQSQMMRGYSMMNVNGSVYVAPTGGGGAPPQDELEAAGGIPYSLLSLFPVVTWNSATMGMAMGGDGGNSSDNSSDHSDLTSCRVCLLDYEDGDLVKTLPCMHRFHSECIDKWLATHRTCPVCKTYVDARSSFEVGVPANAPAS